jgi:hypothetical protein
LQVARASSHVADGSKGDLTALKCDFRYTPESRHAQAEPASYSSAPPRPGARTSGKSRIAAMR